MNISFYDSYTTQMWIEPTTVPSFTSPANITLICQILSSTIPLTSISFYILISSSSGSSSTIPIGTATPNQPLLWTNVNAGSYQIVGVGKDKLEGESNSSVLVVNVWGPVVTPVSPVNASVVNNPVSINLQVLFYFSGGIRTHEPGGHFPKM